MPVRPTDLVIGVAILLAVVVATVALLRPGTFNDRAPAAPEESSAAAAEQQIDPALICYEQAREIPVAMRKLRALAVGPDNRIYVGGDQVIHVLDSSGAKQSEITLDAPPRCLAVGPADHAFPGRLYVGMDDHVEVYGADGLREATWDALGEQALLTCIALAEEDVFVADAGNRIVLRHDPSGKLKNRIGAPDERRHIPGFAITSAYFDLAVCPDRLLRVVNPRALRIEAYAFDGDLELYWGKPSAKPDGFFGCCNPVHVAVFPDGRFVTAEKGIPRVKIYSPEGEFKCVVAGPDQLAVGSEDVIADMAIDGRGQVLVLAARAGGLQVFRPKQTGNGAKP